MPSFLVTVSVSESKVMPCNRVRVEGDSKLKGIAQPFHSLNAPMVVDKQTRPVA